MSKDLTLKNIMHSFVFHWILIMLVSSVGGYFLGLIWEFSEENLYWLTSTIFQGFGAMIAIVVVLSIRHHDVLSDKYNRQVDLSLGIIDRLRSSPLDVGTINKYLENEIKMVKESGEKITKEKLDVVVKSDPFFQSTLFLLVWSLIILTFINQLGSFYERFPVGGNIIMAMVSVFLVILSVYCLVRLSSRIYSAL